LPNGEIFLPQDELALAVRNLDSDGWSTLRDTYYPATMMRIKVQLCTIREEILELALGVNVDGSEARIK
jgi:hypothetical protein